MHAENERRKALLGTTTVMLHDWITSGSQEWSRWVVSHLMDSSNVLPDLVVFWCSLIVRSVTALRSYVDGNELTSPQQSLLFGSALDISRDTGTASAIRDMVVAVAAERYEDAGEVLANVKQGALTFGGQPWVGTDVAQLERFLRTLVLLTALTVQQEWHQMSRLECQQRVADLRQLLVTLRKKLSDTDWCLDDLEKVFNILQLIDDRATTITPGDDLLGGKS